MNERFNKLRLDAGIARLNDYPRLVVIDIEGNIVDPLIGLQKYAELIVRDCYSVIIKSQRDILIPQLHGMQPDNILESNNESNRTSCMH